MPGEGGRAFGRLGEGGRAFGRLGDGLVLAAEDAGGRTVRMEGAAKVKFSGAWALGAEVAWQGAHRATFRLKGRRQREGTWAAFGFADPSIPLTASNEGGVMERPAHKFLCSVTGHVLPNEHLASREGGDGDEWEKYTKSIRDGDGAITAVLDTDEGTLSFQTDGYPFPAAPAYTGLKGLNLVPAIFLSGEGLTTELVMTVDAPDPAPASPLAKRRRAGAGAGAAAAAAAPAPSTPASVMDGIEAHARAAEQSVGYMRELARKAVSDSAADADRAMRSVAGLKEQAAAARDAERDAVRERDALQPWRRDLARVDHSELPALLQDVKCYEAEIETRIREHSLCVVCLESPRVAVFLPCQHRSACLPCARQVKAENAPCPSCRAPILECFVPID